MEGFEVRNLRNRLGVSQAGLGQLIGRTRTTIGDYESNGISDPAVTMALRGLLKDARHDTVGGMDNDAADLGAFLSAAAELRDTVRERTTHAGKERYDVIPGQMRATFPVRALLTREDQTMTGTTHADLMHTGLGGNQGPLQEELGIQRLGARFIQLADPWPNKLTATLEDPAGVWHDDDADIGSDVVSTFTDHDLVRHTLRIGPVSLTRRLRKQSDALRLVMDGMRRSFMQTLAGAALTGQGSADPTGLLNVAGIPTTDLENSTALTDLHNAVETLEGRLVNVSRLGVLAHPGVKRALSVLAYGDQFAWMHQPNGQTCIGLPAATSTALPAGTLVIGDWSRLIVYHGSVFDLSAHVSAGDTRTIYGWLDADVRVVHNNAFQVLENAVAGE